MHPSLHRVCDHQLLSADIWVSENYPVRFQKRKSHDGRLATQFPLLKNAADDGFKSFDCGRTCTLCTIFIVHSIILISALAVSILIVNFNTIFVDR